MEMARKAWSKKSIIEEVKPLEARGVDFHSPNIRKNYPKLWDASMVHFHSWFKTLEVSGIDPDKYRILRPKGCWNATTIPQTLQDRKEKGLSNKAETLRKELPGLLKACYKIYGSHRRMLEEAGLYEAKQTKWNKKKVVAEIISLNNARVDIRPRSLQKSYSGLYRAGTELYRGSWRMYLAAGIDPEALGIRPRWDEETIAEYLKVAHSRNEDILPSALWARHHGLCVAARRIFGGHRQMYLAAGINPDEIGYRDAVNWDSSSITRRLKELDRGGADLNARTLSRDYPGLYQAGKRVFGDLRRMYVAAGIPSERYVHKRRRIWSEKKVKEDILKRYNEGKKLDRQSVLKENYALVRHAYEFYGGYYAAIGAAGLNADDYRVEAAKGSWTEDRIRKAIQEMKSKREDLTEAVVRNKRDLRFLYAATYRVFGSWYNALKDSGIDPDDYRRQAIRGFWSDDRILGMIKDMYDHKEDISARHVSLDRSDLFSAACKAFGNYENAVMKAGIDYDSIRRQHKEYTKEELLQFLTTLKDLGFSLDVSSVREYNASIVTATQKRFGSYRKAIEALGLDYDSIRRDAFQMSFKGMVFERYLREALDVLGWNVDYQKTFQFGKERLRPDFVDNNTGVWIDAKLRAHSEGTSRTIRKYQRHVKKVDVIYLDGDERIWPDGSVNFTPIDAFYAALVDSGAEDIVRDFEKLKKGIVRPELQSGLERFLKRTR